MVQGAEATSIARIGLFAPQIILLATGPDSARTHYEAFRIHHNRSARFTLVSLVTTLAAGALYYGSDEDAVEWAGIGLLAVGVGFSLAASSNGAKGRDHLSLAIWFHNRTVAGVR